VSIRRADGAMVEWLEHNELNASHPFAKYMPDLLPTEFGTIKAKRRPDLHYSMIKPANFDATKRYPVFLFTYGGPHSQQVTRGWGNMFNQYMAQQGFVVFTPGQPRLLAPRARSPTSSTANWASTKSKTRSPASTGWPSRASSIQARRRVRLELWRLHDAAPAGGGVGQDRDGRVGGAGDRLGAVRHPLHRAVRGRHAEVESGSLQGSGVFAHLDGLKSPLLLVHGMADDNVLFTNTTRLIDALVNRNVQFELMTYPGAKHGISRASQRHVYGMIEASSRRTWAEDERSRHHA
jgi:dipeptidyl-peptidase-4